MRRLSAAAAGIAFVLSSAPAFAHEITAKPDPNVQPTFDIVRAEATTDGRLATFVLELAGRPGKKKPKKTGKLPGAKVTAYVWPTKLDPEVAGFAKGSGILALAATAHPDFDDTPLFDEDGDGNASNDGTTWHSHWVVLSEDKACGAGLKVRDISPGAEPMPETAPGLPIALDSPGMSPLFGRRTVRITVPVKGVENVAFDGVTAELQVHAKGETPLLCVTSVHKVASGDLSMPGRIVKK
jgi:hypothetical protein